MCKLKTQLKTTEHTQLLENTRTQVLVQIKQNMCCWRAQLLDFLNTPRHEHKKTRKSHYTTPITPRMSTYTTRDEHNTEEHAKMYMLHTEIRVCTANILLKTYLNLNILQVGMQNVISIYQI